MFSTRIPVLDLIAPERRSFRPPTPTGGGIGGLADSAGHGLCAFQCFFPSFILLVYLQIA